MRKTILDNIKIGLESNIGQSSTVYTDLKIEDIQTRIPDTLTVNYFIGITIDRSNTRFVEIGRYSPTVKEYECKVNIFIRNGDFDLSQTELDTIVNRIIKYFSLDSGNLNGESLTKDGVTENIISYNIDSIDYDIKENSVGIGCSISIMIRTNLNF